MEHSDTQTTYGYDGDLYIETHSDAIAHVRDSSVGNRQLSGLVGKEYIEIVPIDEQLGRLYIRAAKIGALNNVANSQAAVLALEDVIQTVHAYAPDPLITPTGGLYAPLTMDIKWPGVADDETELIVTTTMRMLAISMMTIGRISPERSKVAANINRLGSISLRGGPRTIDMATITNEYQSANERLKLVVNGDCHPLARLVCFAGGVAFAHAETFGAAQA